MAEALTEINLMNLNKSDLQLKAKEIQASLINIVADEKKKDLTLFETRLQLIKLKYEQVCADSFTKEGGKT